MPEEGTMGAAMPASLRKPFRNSHRAAAHDDGDVSTPAYMAAQNLCARKAAPYTKGTLGARRSEGIGDGVEVRIWCALRRGRTFQKRQPDGEKALLDTARRRSRDCAYYDGSHITISDYGCNTRRFMLKRSRYDELHDKYNAIITTKSGTRYERLAAMVFKALEQNHVVIHDVSLIGASDVAHQIDVKVTVNGQSRHILIECKDFDISGDKVGPPIVRNFWAVVDDTKAEEAIIITCNDFTKDAAKYAKAKGIKLVVLRSFEDSDWDGRIKTVIVNLVLLAPANPQVTINLPDAAEKQKFAEATNSLMRPGGIHQCDAVFMVKGQERVHFNRFLTERMNKSIPFANTPDKMNIRVDSDGWRIEVAGYDPVGFDRLDLTFDVHKNERQSAITSARMAELILSGFGDDDVIIFGDQLERHKIDPNSGEVL
jgi:hypothetical protein